jgi:hypothetical protein
LATEATSPEARKAFEDLARTWTRLAADLEMAQALLDAREEEQRMSPPQALMNLRGGPRQKKSPDGERRG